MVDVTDQTEDATAGIDESVADAKSDGATSNGHKRERSRIAFPYEDLSAAIDVVEAVHNRYGGTADYDQTAAALNSTSSSGAFRSKVGAARMFGLVETGRRGRQGIIQVTDLGVRALGDDADAKRAKAEAFLNVELYKALYDNHRRGLPNDDGLEHLIGELGVASKQVSSARNAFQRSAEQAGYFHAGTDKLVDPPLGRIDSPGNGDEHGDADENRVDPGNGRDDSNHDEGEMPGTQADPLLASLFQKLPPADQGFSAEDRKTFITALEAIFTMVYGSDEERNRAVHDSRVVEHRDVTDRSPAF